MAKIKYGAVITDSRGSIGGDSFTWTRYGTQWIHKPTPRGTQTPSNSKTRAIFANYSKRWWSILTPTQRTDWRALAAANPQPNTWGDEFPLTGLAYFIKVNGLLAAANAAGLDDAPANQTVTAPLTFAIAITAPSTIAVTFTTTPVPTDHVAYLFATPGISPGVANYDGRYLFLGASAASQTSPWNVASIFGAKFGSAIAGRQYAARLAFLNTDNGARSTFLLNATIAT